MEGAVIKGTVVAIEKDLAVIDVGLKTEGRVPLKEFAVPGREPTLKVGDEVEVYLERVENALGEAVLVAREGPPRGELGQARGELQQEREGDRRHLQPGQGRLHRRSRRRRGLPAAQPGRHPPGARRQPADAHAAALPDPQDGQAPRQHRRVAPHRAGRDPRRAALRAGPEPRGRPDHRRRGQEHHRLRRLRRPRRHRRPAARHRHRLAAHQPPVRGAVDRPDRQGADHPGQPRDPPHLARHEAARGRSVGGHRGQVSGRRQVHGPRHQHHRLRRLRRAGAGHRGPDPRLRDVAGPRRTSTPARSSRPARKSR